MKRLTTALAMLVVVTPAEAAPSPPATTAPQAEASTSTAHRHLGFALRFEPGIGLIGSNAYGSNQWELMNLARTGVSGSFGIVAGGALIENLILAADFWGTATPSPAGGDSAYGLGAIGVNVTYYLMPHNVFVSASPSIAKLWSVRSDGSSHATTAGFALKLAVGKEWWISDHWGLGVAGQFFFASNDDKSIGATWKTVAGGLALSATYN